MLSCGNTPFRGLPLHRLFMSSVCLWHIMGPCLPLMSACFPRKQPLVSGNLHAPNSCLGYLSSANFLGVTEPHSHNGLMALAQQGQTALQKATLQCVCESRVGSTTPVGSLSNVSASCSLQVYRAAHWAEVA